MKKYVLICLLCVQSLLSMQQGQMPLQKQRSVIERTKKREAVSRVIIVKKISQPILIAGSGEFSIEKNEPESIIDLLKSNDSLSDQACSPSLFDYLS